MKNPQTKSNKIDKELSLVAKRHRGLLRPRDVVAYAEDPETALHGCFEWDDESAGHRYRLWQARQLISVRVTVIQGMETSVRAYVSLAPQRGVSGGGYRPVRDVLSDEAAREQLLADALAELETVRTQYESLVELAGVWAEMDRVAKKKRRRKSA